MNGQNTNDANTIISIINTNILGMEWNGISHLLASDCEFQTEK